MLPIPNSAVVGHHLQLQPNSNSNWSDYINKLLPVGFNLRFSCPCLIMVNYSSGTNELLAIKALQKEFQQLGQIAHGCSPTTSRSPTHPFESTTALSSFGCPRISITDEHNRSLPPGSSTFDPINMFEHKANEVVFGQRPATVIGFASTSKSGTSSPEQTIKNMESRVKVHHKYLLKSYVSSLPLSRIVQELKNCLNQMMIQFEETNEIVYMDQEMRRLSIPTGIEIGCATLPPEQKSHVEFAIVGSDSPTSELLCEELISRLRILDTNSIMQ
uniref:KH_dom_type_1 domain-containing protein n=1 Tax=Heterorhabditis bacteriophora TaxID=37862 RepID=A0A1I7WX76_HETBA